MLSDKNYGKLLIPAQVALQVCDTIAEGKPDDWYHDETRRTPPITSGTWWDIVSTSVLPGPG